MSLISGDDIMTHNAPTTRAPVAALGSGPTRRDANVHPLTSLRSIRRGVRFVLDVADEANRLRRSLRPQHLVPDA